MGFETQKIINDCLGNYTQLIWFLSFLFNWILQARADPVVSFPVILLNRFIQVTFIGRSDFFLTSHLPVGPKVRDGLCNNYSRRITIPVTFEI